MMSEDEIDEHGPLRFARSALAKEMEYRREKQWRIFGWASSLLLAITGGVIALSAEGNFRFTFAQRMAMGFSVFVLAMYSVIWVRANIKYESLARIDVAALDKQLGVPGDLPEPQGKPLFGYIAVLVLLALAAVWAITLAPGTQPRSTTSPSGSNATP